MILLWIWVKSKYFYCTPKLRCTSCKSAMKLLYLNFIRTVFCLYCCLNANGSLRVQRIHLNRWDIVETRHTYFIFMYHLKHKTNHQTLYNAQPKTYWPTHTLTHTHTMHTHRKTTHCNASQRLNWIKICWIVTPPVGCRWTCDENVWIF